MGGPASLSLSDTQAFWTAVVGALSVVGSAWIAFKAKNLETKSGKESAGVTALTAAVQEWKDIAKRADEKADAALAQAQQATHTAERAERDTVTLVEYLRDTWLGFITGTVPPHLPIPESLRHLLSPRDFPLPPGMRSRYQQHDEEDHS